MTMRKLLSLVGLFSVITFCGCPDYSHLKEVPDYENMTDGGSEEGVEQFTDEEE